ncbi:MAG: alpha/beta fold hydrolase [Actinomycetes bacterium]
MIRVLGLMVAVALTIGGCTRAPTTSVASGAVVHSTVVAGRALAYCATRPIESWTPLVRRVIVAVHGLDRDACPMRLAVLNALGGEPDDAMVIAPLFGTAGDALPGGHAWRRLDWPAGGESTSGVSSYEVMDALVDALGDRSVTMVGFSGGGQFANRYAAVSARTLDRYVVVNPSSYLWFTPDRPASTASCPGWNDWRYGLADRQGYVARDDAATVRARYAARDVRYLIGSEDDDAWATNLDRSCAAMTQGVDRVERALNYYEHLADTFGADIEARQPLHIVRGAGHDARAMLSSGWGREAMAG